MSTKDNTPLLTEQELARRWDITTRTLFNWRRDGKGPPFVMVGKRRRYRLSDIEAYEEQMLQKPGADN